MGPFNTPDPTTYATLLNVLRDEALHFLVAPDDFHRISHAASRIAHLQANYANLVNCRSCGDEAPLSPYLRCLISDLEDLGVRGWVRSLEECRLHGFYEELKQVLEMKCQQVVELRETKRELLELIEVDKKLDIEGGETAKVMPQGIWLNAAELPVDILQFGEENKKLMGIIERLERLAVLEEVDAEASRDADIGGPLRVHEDLELSGIESEIFGNETDSVQTRTERGKSHRRPRPLSESSVVVELDSLSVRSPTASAVGVGLSKDLEYPPPLQLSTEQEHRDEDKNSKRQEEKTPVWSNAQRELQESFPPSTNSPSPPNRFLPPFTIDTAPSYIFIPLPGNFTLPQYNSHLPSLTFKAPPSVFHFPQGAKKDQLLTVLRQRCATSLPILDLEPLESVNVIQVRTHHMESELKNAIRKSMTQEQWEENIRKQWYTEGKGDTYIVSKSNVRFHGVSGAVANRCDEAEVHEKPRIRSSDVDESNDDHQEQPRLRGGASSPILDDRERRSFAPLSSETWAFDVPDYHREALDDIDDANKHGFQRAYIEYARILQLQNASQNRLIEHLQDIIKDMEETFDWQDNVLDTMHCRVEHWKHKATTEKADAAKARKEADVASRETEELKALVQEINEQVSRFHEDLEPKVDELEKWVWDEAALPEVRGARFTEEAPTSVGPDTTLDDEMTGPQDIDATAFYYFPSVSIMVLLTTPVCYFQWPRCTTLAQARDILQYHYTNGLETNAHLGHIREIMELREDMGISLPDTSDNRQVLIALPVIESKIEDKGTTGRGSKWEKSFGPDEYERMLREQLRNLEALGGDDCGELSPPSSDEEETYHDSNDLVNLINDHIDTVCTPHGSCRICDGKRESYPPCVKPGMQNPYATPSANVRGGGHIPTPITPPPSTMPSSILYPSYSFKRPPLSRKSTKPIVPENLELFHPARRSEERRWNVIRYPPVEDLGNEYAPSELERPANYGYEHGIGSVPQSE